MTASRSLAPVFCSSWICLGSSVLRAPEMSESRPVRRRCHWNAAPGRAKPRGTRIPRSRAAWVSSPRDAFFPPTLGRSRMVISENQRTPASEGRGLPAGAGGAPPDAAATSVRAGGTVVSEGGAACAPAAGAVCTRSRDCGVSSRGRFRSTRGRGGVGLGASVGALGEFRLWRIDCGCHGEQGGCRFRPRRGRARRVNCHPAGASLGVAPFAPRYG